MEHHSEQKTKEELIISTLEKFFTNFGEIDIYSKIVLEEFMEALLEK